jgi:hypothetical protein
METGTPNKKDVAAFLHCLRKISDSTESFGLLHGHAADDVTNHASSLYDILANYITAHEYNPDQKGNTKLLQFFSQLVQQCTEDEALQIYLFAAESVPDYRWTQYSRHLRPASRDEWESVLLQAYLKATSQSFMTFFRMLLSNLATMAPSISVLQKRPIQKLITAAALSVSAMDILCIGDFGYAGVSDWKPGTFTFGNHIRIGR